MSMKMKFLTGCLLVSLVVGVGDELIYKVLFGDVHQSKMQLAKLDKQLGGKKLRLRELENRCQVVRDASETGLPADPATANIVFQEYLVGLAAACQLKSIVIETGQPEQIDGLGHTLHFSVNGSGETKQIGRFIDGFYDSSTMQRLTHVNIFQSLGPDSPKHSFSFDIEALTLNDVGQGDQRTEELSVPKSFELNNLFAQRDIFRRPAIASPRGIRNSKLEKTKSNSLMNFMSKARDNVSDKPNDNTNPKTESARPKSPQVARKPPKPKIDPKKFTRFVGVISNGRQTSALFSNEKSDKRLAIDQRGNLERLGIQARLLSVSGESVVLSDQNGMVELRLGKRLSEAMPMSEN